MAAGELGDPFSRRSRLRDRVYVRKFDRAEARRLRERGLTYREIGERLGVSATAIGLALNPRSRMLNELNSALWIMSGRCRECGAACTNRPSRDGLGPRCHACYAKSLVTTVRADSLRCVDCKRWLPDSMFPQYHAAEYRRYRYRSCRECSTSRRREYRERTKVPCDACGQPVGHPRDGNSTGLCRTCYQEARRLGF